MLAETGRLYDIKKGEALPEGISPISVLDDTALNSMIKPGTNDIQSRFVAGYSTLQRLSTKSPVVVIGENGQIKGRPGFLVDFISRESLAAKSCTTKRHETLMPV